MNKVCLECVLESQVTTLIFLFFNGLEKMVNFICILTSGAQLCRFIVVNPVLRGRTASV